MGVASMGLVLFGCCITSIMTVPWSCAALIIYDSGVACRLSGAMVPGGIWWELTNTTDSVSSRLGNRRRSYGKFRSSPAPHVFAVTSSPSFILFIQLSQLSESLAFSCTIFLVNSGTRDINTV